MSRRIGPDPAASKPDDAEAVRRARDGDREAFRVLVERHQGRAYRLALRVLRDEEGARDVVQDAFLKAWGSLDRFEGRSGFYTWLYRIVMNLCLDRRRRSHTRREVEWSEAAVARSRTLRFAGFAQVAAARGFCGGRGAAAARRAPGLIDTMS